MQLVPAIVYKAGPAFLIEIAGNSVAALGGHAVPVEGVRKSVVKQGVAVDEVWFVAVHCRGGQSAADHRGRDAEGDLADLRGLLIGRSRRSRQQGQAQAEGQQKARDSFLHEISSLSGDHILCFWGPCLHLRL